MTTLTGTNGNNSLGSSVDGDIIFGDSGNALTVDGPKLTSGKVGNDKIVGKGNNQSLYGDVYTLTGTAKAANDTIEAEYAVQNITIATTITQTLYGDANTIELTLSTDNVKTGDDKMEAEIHVHGATAATSATQNLYGDAQNVGGIGSLIAGTVTFGNDELFAEVTGVASGYTTTLYGDALNTFIDSGGSVKCGNDTLIAGKSDVTMWGDVKTINNSGGTITTGADTFVFDLCKGIGKDTVGDFKGIALNSNDILKFHGVTNSDPAFSTVANVLFV